MNNLGLQFVETLQPVYDSAKSFYDKAKIYKDNKGNLFLQSYDTIVAMISDKCITSTLEYEVKLFGYYSRTTARHINEWLRQRNFISKPLTKNEIERRCM